MQNVNPKIIAAARAQNGITRGWDSEGQHGYDREKALGFDLIATAGLSTFTFTLDNNHGLGFALNIPMFNGLNPIWLVNDGTTVPNSGGNQIDATLDNASGSVFFYLHSDHTKYAVLSCKQMPYSGAVASSIIRPFLVRTAQYNYVSTDATQTANDIIFQTKNVFGRSSSNPLAPSQFTPLALQTPGILGIDLRNSNNASDYMVNAESQVTHLVNASQVVTFIWGVSLINTGNISAS